MQAHCARVLVALPHRRVARHPGRATRRPSPPPGTAPVDPPRLHTCGMAAYFASAFMSVATLRHDLPYPARLCGDSARPTCLISPAPLSPGHAVTARSVGQSSEVAYALGWSEYLATRRKRPLLLPAVAKPNLDGSVTVDRFKTRSNAMKFPLPMSTTIQFLDTEASPHSTLPRAYPSSHCCGLPSAATIVAPSPPSQGHRVRVARSTRAASSQDSTAGKLRVSLCCLSVSWFPLSMLWLMGTHPPS